MHPVLSEETVKAAETFGSRRNHTFGLQTKTSKWRYFHYVANWDEKEEDFGWLLG